MEPYRDDFDDEEGAEAPPATASSMGNGGQERSGLRPMAIEVEYTDELREAAKWKAKVAALLAVVFVAIGTVMTRKHRANHFAKRHKPKVCDGFDADYFSEIMHRVQRASLDSTLCDGNPMSSLDCGCHNPFEPIWQERAPELWENAMRQNIELLNTNYSESQPDFVMYGDSITERLLGHNMGHEVDTEKAKAGVTYELFTKEGGGKLNGLPMGISGDEMAHLLYRMQNGEMPESLHPDLWWILIGTNDLGKGCSGDTIVAGNIRIIEEIRHRHESHNHTSDAPIVINSILPRGSKDLLADHNPFWEILHDANQRLACYASITPDVHFVNVTDLFTEERNGGVFVKREYYERDSLHPSVEGSRAWEEFIVENVLALIR